MNITLRRSIGPPDSNSRFSALTETRTLLAQPLRDCESGGMSEMHFSTKILDCTLMPSVITNNEDASDGTGC